MITRWDGDAIVQSTFPATGWYASINSVELGQFYSPLICWALIGSGDQQEVVGLMATDEVVFADEFDGFLSYIHESELKIRATTEVKE